MSSSSSTNVVPKLPQSPAPKIEVLSETVAATEELPGNENQEVDTTLKNPSLLASKGEDDDSHCSIPSKVLAMMSSPATSTPAPVPAPAPTVPAVPLPPKIAERTLMDDIIAAATAAGVGCTSGADAAAAAVKPVNPSPQQRTSTPATKPKESFGMKKGFLLTSSAARKGTAVAPVTSSSSSSTSSSKKVIDVVSKTPEVPLSQKLVADVQQSLQQQSPPPPSLASEDLLQKLLAHPQATAALLHSPKLSHVLSLLRSGAEEEVSTAKALLRADAALWAQFSEIMKVMGQHFEGVSNSQLPPTMPSVTKKSTENTNGEGEDEKVQRVLSDPELRGYLLDPDVRRVLQECSASPERLRYYMTEEDGGKWKAVITKMAAAGLVQISQ